MNNIGNFIDSSIEEMHNTIEYAKTTAITDDKRGYAMRHIDDVYERAFGALLFMKCWAQELTQAEYDKLSDKIIKARFSAWRTAIETL